MKTEAPSPLVASPMDVATTFNKFLQQSEPETAMVATTRSRAVLRAAHSLDFDDVQLLAETEELLGNLDPIAFLDLAHTPQKEMSIALLGSSASNSGDDSSVSQSHMKLDSSSKINRKRGSKPGATRNPSRERMQNELRYLRKQVLVLETELQNVHERNGTSQHSKMVVVPPMWERVAKRQLSACERVLSENKRLKSMLKLQKELVVGLQESFYNWQHVMALPATLSPDYCVPSKNVHLEPGDTLLFEMLVSELDATYLGLDSAFHEAGIDTHSLEPFTRATPKTITSYDNTLRSFFELVEVDVSPFDFELTSRVAGIYSELQSQSPDCMTYERDWGSEDIMTEKHRVKRVVDGVEIYFHTLMALKLYAFDDHVVSVWCSIFKCEDRFPDAYVQETGWFTCASLASTSSSSSDDASLTTVACVTKSCAYLEPKRFHAPAKAIKAEADAMVNLVADFYETDMREMDDMMERLLIEESSKQSNV